jgi:hypothetical protein
MMLMYLRDENALVLSASLDKDAIQILVDVALSSSFPGQCTAWCSAMKNTRERFQKDLTETQHKACEGLVRQETSLQRTLRDVVIEDVMKQFQ